MIKKNYFYILLIIVYFFFLMKDNLFKWGSNLDILTNNINSNKESYYELEYKNISKLLNIDMGNYKVIYSKVVIRNIYDFFDKITILKGSNDSLELGSVVVNEMGLVGVISKVNDNFSEVSLLTNSNIDISVKINDSYGILTSKDNVLIVKNIKLNKEIEVGSYVYTSGLTSVPEGILIGEVSNINKDDLELEYLIEVKPVVDFYDLNYVGVIS